MREKELNEKELKGKEIQEIELREKLEEEKYDSLLTCTNPLLDCDVSFLKDDVGVAPKEESKVQVDNILYELFVNLFTKIPLF